MEPDLPEPLEALIRARARHEAETPPVSDENVAAVAAAFAAAKQTPEAAGAEARPSVRADDAADEAAGALRGRIVFYLSHAPMVGDDLADALFTDLSARIRDAVGASPDEPVGVLGRSRRPDFASGRQLGESLVLVPLYSPRYFATDVCGRTVSAFLDGVDPAGPVPVAPVLWIPLRRPWPPVPASPVGGRGVERYLEDGLFDVMMSRDVDPEAERCYQSVLDALRDEILRLAERSPRRHGRSIDVSAYPNAYSRARQRPTMGLHVLAPTLGRLPAGRDPGQYGPSCLDWNPYRSEAPEGLVVHSDRLARVHEYEPTVRAFDDADTDPLISSRPTGPAVVLLDPWALEDSDWREQLRRFDARDVPWVGIIAAWDLGDPQTEGAQNRLLWLLQSTLPNRFGWRRSERQRDVLVASTLQGLGRAHSAAMQEAAIGYLRLANASAGDLGGPDRRS